MCVEEHLYIRNEREKNHNFGKSLCEADKQQHGVHPYRKLKPVVSERPFLGVRNNKILCIPTGREKGKFQKRLCGGEKQQNYRKNKKKLKL